MSALTIADAIALAAIVDLCQRNAKIARRMDTPERDDDLIVEGIARHICDEHGGFWPHDKDVRDAYVRVTGAQGLSLEYFWPLAEMLDAWKGSEMRELR